jgi:hypothetical protein
MGDYQLIYTAIAAIVFSAAIIGGRFILVSNFLDADVESKSTSRELRAMTLSYSVLDCLRGDEKDVEAQFLEANDGRSLCDLCRICSAVSEAKVTDLESGKEWDFKPGLVDRSGAYLKEKLMLWDSDRFRKDFSVYTNIDYGGYSHIGRIDVRA